MALLQKIYISPKYWGKEYTKGITKLFQEDTLVNLSVSEGV